MELSGVVHNTQSQSIRQQRIIFLACKVFSSSIWNYKSTKHAIFVAGVTAGGRFEMSTAEIIPYPTAGNQSLRELLYKVPSSNKMVLLRNNQDLFNTIWIFVPKTRILDWLILTSFLGSHRSTFTPFIRWKNRNISSIYCCQVDFLVVSPKNHLPQSVWWMIGEAE